jgi:hypothetical protein
MIRVYFNLKTSILLLVLVILNIFIGCSSTSNEDYKNIKINEKVISFSFDYPSFMNKPYVISEDRLDKGRILKIQSVGSIQTDDSQGVEILFIELYRPNIISPDAQTMWEDELASTGNVTIKGISLVDSSFIEISDFYAKKLVYSNIKYDDSLEQDIDEEQFYYLFFDAKGFIWKITLHVYEPILYRGEVDLNHLVDTFKIID